jgi:hypothetical protein
MIVQTQFSVFLVNKPGVLARVLDELAASRINITALTVADTTEHGVLRIVSDDPDAVRECLSRLDLPTAETKVIEAPIPNRPGAVASLCDRLASARININYAYCTAGTQGNKTTCILKVADPKKAERVLDDNRPRRKERRTTKRRPRSPAR